MMKSATAFLHFLVLLIAAATEARAQEQGGIRQAEATDVHFERTLTCFTRDSVSSLVNTGTEPLIATNIFITDPTGEYFDIKVPKVPDTLNPGESLRIPVTFNPSAPGNFAATINYEVWSLDGSSKVGDYRSELDGEGYTIQVRAHIERNYRVIQGTEFMAQIILDEHLDTAEITKFSIEVTYEGGMLYLSSNALSNMTAGTLLEGWNVLVTDIHEWTISAQFTAPPGVSLTGRGLLLNLPFRTVHDQSSEWDLPSGDSIETELYFDINPSNRECATVLTAPGHVIIDRVKPLTLYPLMPNPVINNTFIAQFDVDSEEIVTLDVIASTGELITRLIEELRITPGRYYRQISTTGLAPGEYILAFWTKRQKSIQRLVVLR